MSKREMGLDFDKFAKFSSNFSIRGFHAPQGKWSLKSFKFFRVYDYWYEVTGGGEKGLPKNIKIGKKFKIIRLKTLGDDWPFYLKKMNSDDVFNSLVNYTLKINNGDIYGIGFHPWILLTNEEMITAFIKFLEYIKSKSDFEILPAIEYIKLIKGNE